MTLTDDQRDEVVRLRLDNAREALDDARLLLNRGSVRGAVSRAYYAMFHAASALAVLDRQTFRKHSGLLAYFHRTYAGPERIDRKHGRALQKAFDDRSEADYEDHVDLDLEQANTRVDEAAEFLAVVEALVNERLST